MKSPLVIGFLLVLLSVSVSAATCSIDGDWTKTQYYGGDTMRFDGSISPTSGFISGYIENPVGDKVAQIPNTEITSDFDIRVKTNGSYLNGTYRVRMTYVSFANNTPCGESISVSTGLKTNNTKGDLNLNLTIAQSFNTAVIDITGAPVETPLGTLTSRIRGSGIPGLVPSIKLVGTQLAAGSSIGNININLTQCQNNENIMKAYRDIGNFLSSNYSDTVGFQLENERLKGIIGDEMSGLTKEKADLEADKLNLTSQVSTWKAIAGGKLDWWLAAIVFVLLGFFGHILLQRAILQDEANKYDIPHPLETSGIKPYPHKDNGRYY